MSETTLRYSLMQYRGIGEWTCDMVLIFHVPLFSSWLREVLDNDIRVQMVIDGPDDLEQLQSPEGLKKAVIYAHQLYEKTKKIHVTSKAGTDLCYEIGEYPVMSQYGMADEPGRFDQWGVGHIHTFPNEGSSYGTVVIQPGDIVIFGQYGGNEIKLDGEDYLILGESDIFGIVE